MRQEESVVEVARTIGASSRWVSKWKARWLLSPCVETLGDQDRAGRPVVISIATKCELVKLACHRPRASAFAMVWTQQGLADALHRKTGARVSRSTVQRVLSSEGLKPHRVRQTACEDLVLRAKRRTFNRSQRDIGSSEATRP